MTDNERVLLHQGSAKWVKAFVPYHRKDWIQSIKSIPGRWWSKPDNCWLLPNSEQTISQLRMLFGEHLEIDLVTPATPLQLRKEAPPPKVKQQEQLSGEQQLAVTALEQQLMLERKSFQTVKSYKHHLQRFFLHHAKVAPEQLGEAEIKAYLLHHIKISKISESTQNQIINSIKAYYERVLGQNRKTYYLPRPKKPNQLPHVLSEEEVLAILKAPDNLKHQCILLLVYSGGLRLSEVVNLKIKDIDSQRMQIFIQGGKGKKDRYTLLSKKALLYLRKYYKEYRPKDWLFEGQHGGEYSKRSVQNVFQAACQKAKIQKRPTLHTLRHSFATHLLEKGVDLR